MYQQFATVLAVFAILAGVLVLLRAKPRLRLRPLGGRGTSTIESIGRLVLTAQHSLHVVRVGQNLFIVGTCPGTITLIRQLDSGTDSRAGELP